MTLAQYTPEKGSAERKAITGALRVKEEKKVKQSVVFKIDHLKVQDDWAFLFGAPRRPDGGKLNYSKTPYAEAQRAGMFDDNIIALLQNSAAAKGARTMARRSVHNWRDRCGVDRLG